MHGFRLCSTSSVLSLCCLQLRKDIHGVFGEERYRSPWVSKALNDKKITEWKLRSYCVPREQRVGMWLGHNSYFYVPSESL